MLRHVEIRTWKIQLFFAFVTRPPTRAAFAAAAFAYTPKHPHKHRQIKHQHVLVVLTSRIAFKQPIQQSSISYYLFIMSVSTPTPAVVTTKANLWQSMALGGAAASFAVNFTHPIVRSIFVELFFGGGWI